MADPGAGPATTVIPDGVDWQMLKGILVKQLTHALFSDTLMHNMPKYRYFFDKFLLCDA